MSRSSLAAIALLFVGALAREADAQTVSGPPYASKPAPVVPPEPELGPLGITGAVVGGIGVVGVVTGGVMMLFEMAQEPCRYDPCSGDRTVFFTGLTIGLVGLGGFVIPGAIMFGVDRATAPTPKRKAEVPDVSVGPTSAALRWQF